VAGARAPSGLIVGQAYEIGLRCHDG
jgi:hypothetical protein